MKIYVIPGLERYKKIFQRVAQKYLDHLNHRSLMAGKLYDLSVFISFCEDNIPTCGTMELDFPNNHVINRILIRINTNDSDKHIAHIMAHELAHVLFGCSNNYFMLGLNSNSKCEAAGSSFKRYDFTNDEEFGIGLEEGAAELLAQYITAHSRFSDKFDTYPYYERIESFYSLLRNSTNFFANCFGESLFNSNYIDSVNIDKYIVPPEHPLYNEMEDVYDEDLWVTNRHFFNKYLDNPFWYHTVTNTFHCIIDEYDECMGKGAFKKLSKDFDLLYNQYDEFFDVPDSYTIALDYLSKIESQIREFSRIYAEKPQEQLEGISVKFKKYVEEQKKTADRV